MATFISIPRDIWGEILGKLTSRAIRARCMLVCRQWRDIIRTIQPTSDDVYRLVDENAPNKVRCIFQYHDDKIRAEIDTHAYLLCINKKSPEFFSIIEEYLDIFTVHLNSSFVISIMEIIIRNGDYWRIINVFARHSEYHGLLINTAIENRRIKCVQVLLEYDAVRMSYANYELLINSTSMGIINTFPADNRSVILHEISKLKFTNGIRIGIDYVKK